MIYRVYLCRFDGQSSDKTTTTDIAAAEAAFAALVNRADLAGQKVAAVLTGDNERLAFHHFGHPPGRPVKMEGGKRVQVYMDAESLRIAAKIGDGNISAGIREALKRASNLIEEASD